MVSEMKSLHYYVPVRRSASLANCTKVPTPEQRSDADLRAKDREMAIRLITMHTDLCPSPLYINDCPQRRQDIQDWNRYRT